MTDAPPIRPISLSHNLAPRPADRRAELAAQARLDARLHYYGKQLGQSPAQVANASIERGGDAFRNPATNAQRIEAFELATSLEASLPAYSGTALLTRAQVIINLLDPPGSDRLTVQLRQARELLGITV